MNAHLPTGSGEGAIVAATATAPRKRNVDPELVRLRGALAGAVSQGLPADDIARRRAELNEAKILTAARRLAAQLPELSPEKRAYVASMLRGCAGPASASGLVADVA